MFSVLSIAWMSVSSSSGLHAPRVRPGRDTRRQCCATQIVRHGTNCHAAHIPTRRTRNVRTALGSGELGAELLADHGPLVAVALHQHPELLVHLLGPIGGRAGAALIVVAEALVGRVGLAELRHRVVVLARVLREQRALRSV